MLNLLLLATSLARPSSSRFEGRLLGVRADVELFKNRQVAQLRLSGAPLGGTIEGTACFKADGSVELDEKLERALRRRRVVVKSVESNEAVDRLSIELSLPVFGVRGLHLHSKPNKLLPETYPPFPAGGVNGT